MPEGVAIVEGVACFRIVEVCFYIAKLYRLRAPDQCFKGLGVQRRKRDVGVGDPFEEVEVFFAVQHRMLDRLCHARRQVLLGKTRKPAHIADDVGGKMEAADYVFRVA